MSTDQHLQELGSTARPLPVEGQSLSTWRTAKPDYRIDPETECWEWLKFKDRKGYGRCSKSFGGFGTQYAYRAYWMAANGQLDPGMAVVVDHLCRNHGCVNPKHLEGVPQAKNVHRGKQAKLTMEIARAVRRMVVAGDSNKAITAATGVTTQNIWWIAEDRAWREDPDAPRAPVFPIRDCLYCGDPVPPERSRKARYCSIEHGSAAKREAARLKRAA